MSLNRFQTCLKNGYENGEFSHVTSLDESKAQGDGFFTFLMVELSSKEDCTSKHEALRRLDSVRRQLDDIIMVIENCPDDVENAA